MPRTTARTATLRPELGKSQPLFAVAVTVQVGSLPTRTGLVRYTAASPPPPPPPPASQPALLPVRPPTRAAPAAAPSPQAAKGHQPKQLGRLVCWQQNQQHHQQQERERERERDRSMTRRRRARYRPQAIPGLSKALASFRVVRLGLRVRRRQAAASSSASPQATHCVLAVDFNLTMSTTCHLFFFSFFFPLSIYMRNALLSAPPSRPSISRPYVRPTDLKIDFEPLVRTWPCPPPLPPHPAHACPTRAVDRAVDLGPFSRVIAALTRPNAGGHGGRMRSGWPGQWPVLAWEGLEINFQGGKVDLRPVGGWPA